MIEQWFLDLDGVRSGPYQTPEVMSLIAEGEVLPHHRISTSLREQRWSTILDWRLDQAKISQNPTPSPFTKSRSEVSSVEGLDEVPPTIIEIPEELSAKAPPAVEAPTEIEPERAAILDALPISTPEVKTSEETISEESAPAYEEPAPIPAYTPPPAPPVHEAGEPRSENRPKRDPMAEMFDMLQKTKQKRESKRSREDSSGILMEHDEPVPQKGGGIMRTLMIGGGITLIGFALGQIFQQAAPPKEPVAALPKASPFASVTPAAHTPAPVAEVMDRSTDKMTIRTVDHKAEGTPAPNNKISGHTLRPSTTTASENPQNEKEIEELRNLKKELQELKALKNNAPDDEMEMPEGDGLDAKDPGLDPAYHNEPGANYPKGYPNNTNNYPPEGGQQPLGAEQPPER